ncbi:hypothetical protein V8C34DRAFT_270895, partial [Trichoderma compactum]
MYSDNSTQHHVVALKPQSLQLFAQTAPILDAFPIDYIISSLHLVVSSSWLAAIQFSSKPEPVVRLPLLLPVVIFNFPPVEPGYPVGADRCDMPALSVPEKIDTCAMQHDARAERHRSVSQRDPIHLMSRQSLVRLLVPPPGARVTDYEAVEHKDKISGYFIPVSESRGMAPDPFAVNRGSRGYRDGDDAISHFSLHTRGSPVKMCIFRHVGR